MELIEIFTQMQWVPALLLIVGVVMLIVELFVPGFGFFGVTGTISLAAGVVVRICYGLNLTQSLTLILITLGFMTLVVMLMVFGAQYGILGKTGLFERGTTLSKDYNEAERKIKKLVGKSGKAISKLDLAGKAKIKGRIYDVCSVSSYVEAGQNIKVVEIKDNTIMVRKWFE
jgi:membrane-bound serine protease (ClpP class)